MSIPLPQPVRYQPFPFEPFTTLRQRKSPTAGPGHRSQRCAASARPIDALRPVIARSVAGGDTPRLPQRQPPCRLPEYPHRGCKISAPHTRSSARKNASPATKINSRRSGQVWPLAHVAVDALYPLTLVAPPPSVCGSDILHPPDERKAGHGARADAPSEHARKTASPVSRVNRIDR